MTTTFPAPAAKAAPAAPAAPVRVAPFRLTVDGFDLRRALRLVKRATRDRKQPDVFRAVRFADDGAGGARVTCYDLDLQISVEIAGAGLEGSAAVTWDALDAATRSAGKGDTVEVRATDDGLAYDVKVRGSSARVAPVNAADLPELLEAAERRTPRFIAPAPAFVAGLEAVNVARAEERMRYALTATLLEVRPEFGGALPMVATDGRRLHVVNLRGVNVTAEPSLGARASDVLLPDGAADAAVAAWSGRSASALDVVCEAGPTTNALSAGGVRIIARRNEGSFPSWRDVIPGKGPSAGDLLDVVRLLDVPGAIVALRSIARQSGKGPVVTRWTVREGEIRVAATWADGAASAVLPIEGWLGDDVTFGANPAFVADALEAGCDRLRPMAPTTRHGKVTYSTPFLLSASPTAPGGALDVRCVVMPISLD